MSINKHSAVSKYTGHNFTDKKMIQPGWCEWVTQLEAER